MTSDQERRYGLNIHPISDEELASMRVLHYTGGEHRLPQSTPVPELPLPVFYSLRPDNYYLDEYRAEVMRHWLAMADKKAIVTGKQDGARRKRKEQKMARKRNRA